MSSLWRHWYVPIGATPFRDIQLDVIFAVQARLESGKFLTSSLHSQNHLFRLYIWCATLSKLSNYFSMLNIFITFHCATVLPPGQGCQQSVYKTNMYLNKKYHLQFYHLHKTKNDSRFYLICFILILRTNHLWSYLKEIRDVH